MGGQWHFDAKVEYHLVSSFPLPLCPFPQVSGGGGGSRGTSSVTSVFGGGGSEYSTPSHNSESTSGISLSGISSISAWSLASAPHFKKKRASGLRLLCPTSSRGKPLEPSIHITSLPLTSPVISHIPHTPRLSSFSTVVQRIQLPDQTQLPTPLQPQEDLEDEEEDYALSRREEAYDAQRASLRKVRSITELKKNLDDATGSDKSQILNGPERLLHKRWAAGRVEIVLEGQGGIDGGILRLYHSTDKLDTVSPTYQRHPIFTFPIPRLPPEIDQGHSSWGLGDVQIIHKSISGRPHALSLRIPSKVAHVHLKNSGESIDSDQPSRRRGVLSDKVRIRSKTISGTSDKRDSGDTNASTATTSTSSSFSLAETTGEQTLYLSFPSEKEQLTWLSLLRTLSDGRDVNTSTPRVYRRLKLWVLDLTEINFKIGKEGLQGHGKRSDDPSHCGPDVSVDSVSRDGTADGSRPSRFNSAPGWSIRERIRVELVVDGTLWARTAWAKADSNNTTPFWGECFSFDNFQEFQSCMLLLFRQTRNRRAALFATVQLPLVPSFAHGEDERYPIRSVTNEVVIGELRISVAFREITVLSRSHYQNKNAMTMTAADEMALTYHLAANGQLEDAHESFCRLGLAEGYLLPMLLDMCSFESESTGSTLFRSNTVFTKTLETVMRLLCHDFLQSSIGPTVKHIVESKIVLKLHQDVMGYVPNPSGVLMMIRLAENCWADLYAKRNAFPDFLRHIFAHLFRTVKDVHDDNQKLRYKAVSCFVFLRLLGPALMRPHLFGLAEGLLSPDQQRILTILAKILHALAFFSDKDLGRDPELGLFQGFIKGNRESMVDYLASFATPLDDFQARPSPPSVLQTFISERALHLSFTQSETLPTLTIAGPIDVSAEIAILLETIYEHRRVPNKVASGASNVMTRAIPTPDRDLGEIEEIYGKWLENVHRKSKNVDIGRKESRRSETPISRLSPPPQSPHHQFLLIDTRYPMSTSVEDKDEDNDKPNTTSVSETTRSLSSSYSMSVSTSPSHSMATTAGMNGEAKTLWTALGLCSISMGFEYSSGSTKRPDPAGGGVATTTKAESQVGLVKTFSPSSKRDQKGAERNSSISGNSESLASNQGGTDIFRTAPLISHSTHSRPTSLPPTPGLGMVFGLNGSKLDPSNGGLGGAWTGLNNVDSPSPTSTIVDWLELSNASRSASASFTETPSGSGSGSGSGENGESMTGQRSTSTTSLAVRDFARRPSLTISISQAGV